MRLFDRLKRWAESTDADKVAMDRRAFLKGMAVSSAGILVPGVAVFDLGLSPNYLSMARVFVPNVPLTTTPLLSLNDIKNRRFLLAERMIVPISQRRDYGSIGRNLFTVEPMPEST